ncbi:hypothetical protein C8Q73DRAFT_782422 [Cubamyces lactineus]|nr:hypothetical protein C8Q73DRAFT_782422 [Cubamyces lactineus]
MSYGQQSRNTESWNNDPNNFSNSGGPDAGFQNQRGDWNSSNNEQWGSQRPTRDPTDTSTWNSSSNPQDNQGQFWTAGQGDNYGTTGYQGNTTDTNTYGAGGNFSGTGRGAGVDNGNWQSRNDDNSWQRDSNYDDVTPGAGKASMGERLKGNAEKLAGRVTGNPAMVERGQIRKSGNPDDTSWNSNDY